MRIPIPARVLGAGSTISRLGDGISTRGAGVRRIRIVVVEAAVGYPAGDRAGRGATGGISSTPASSGRIASSQRTSVATSASARKLAITSSSYPISRSPSEICFSNVSKLPRSRSRSLDVASVSIPAMSPISEPYSMADASALTMADTRRTSTFHDFQIAAMKARLAISLSRTAIGLPCEQRPSTSDDTRRSKENVVTMPRISAMCARNSR